MPDDNLYMKEGRHDGELITISAGKKAKPQLSLCNVRLSIHLNI